MSDDGAREAYGRVAADLMDQGATLLKRTAARGREVRQWEFQAMNVLAELDTVRYQKVLLQNFPDDRSRLLAIVDELGNAVSAPHQASEVEGTTRVTEIVKVAAERLGVDMPRSVRLGVATTYTPALDEVSISSQQVHWADEELIALAGHELGHKRQHRDAPDASHAYMEARSAGVRTPNEVTQGRATMPFLLRATTALSTASLRLRGMLLAKTVGYEREFEADAAGAEAASPDAMANVLRRMEQLETRERQRHWRGSAWQERVAEWLHERIERLTDDHPSFASRIERLVGADTTAAPEAQGPATARLAQERSQDHLRDEKPSRER